MKNNSNTYPCRFISLAAKTVPAYFENPATVSQTDRIAPAIIAGYESKVAEQNGTSKKLAGDTRWACIPTGYMLHNTRQETTERMRQQGLPYEDIFVVTRATTSRLKSGEKLTAPNEYQYLHVAALEWMVTSEQMEIAAAILIQVTLKYFVPTAVHPSGGNLYAVVKPWAYRSKK